MIKCASILRKTHQCERYLPVCTFAIGRNFCLSISMTSPSYFRMELWHGLQEELNRLYEMFVERNPYFEANGGKVSIVAHSLGCVVTYDILTGWTQDVEHSWYNLQSGGVPGAGNPGPGPQDPSKRMHSHPHNRRYNNNNMITPAQSGKIKNNKARTGPRSVAGFKLKVHPRID